MATGTVTFQLTIADSPHGKDLFAPSPLTLTLTGQHVRRAVSLPAGETVALDAGELTPKWWVVQNVHATNDLVVSFGASDDVTLSPGEFNFWRSATIPNAYGAAGAASKIYYAVFE